MAMTQDDKMLPKGWRSARIKDIAPLQRGFDLPNRMLEEGTTPVVYSNGIERHHNQAMAKGPGVVTGRSGTLGKVHYVDSDYWPHNTALWVTDFKGNHPKYIYYLYVAIGFERFASGSGVPTLNRNDAHSYEVALPIEHSEQAAIAEALSDVDGLIGALEKLIAKKRAIKQAIMQQLLTGKTRLPGFSGMWENILVEQVISRYFSGPSPTCEERNIMGELEWGVLKTTAATKEYGWDWRKHKVLPKAFWNSRHIELHMGDVIVTKAGPRHRVGVTAWISFVPDSIIPSGKMVALRPNLNRVVPLMLAAAISAKDAQLYLDQRTTGMAESQVNFENTDLLKTPICIPAVPEQKAIASVLSDIDCEIVAIEKRRDKTKQIKQGMMQQLLTGKIRLVKSSLMEAKE